MSRGPADRRTPAGLFPGTLCRKTAVAGAALAALAASAGIDGQALAQSVAVTLPGPRVLPGGPKPPEVTTGPGTVLKFGMSSTLGHDDNRALSPASLGSTSYLENRLSFGILSETAVSQLQFDILGILRWTDMPLLGSDTAFDGPEARLIYRHTGADSLMEVGASYQRVDLNFFNPLSQSDVQGADLVADQGEREYSTASIRLETGIGGPLGFTLGLDHRRYDYTDTTDADLYDNRTTRIALGGRAALSEVADLRLDLAQIGYDAENARQTDRTTRSATLGLDYALSPVDRIEARLGYQKMETTETLSGTRGEETRNGAIGSLLWRRDRPNGAVSLSFDHEIATSGERSTLRIGRQMALPSGWLNANIGYGRTEAGNEGPVAMIYWLQELPRGSVVASLDRQIVTNSNDLDTTSTTMRLDISHDITPLAQIALRANYVMWEVDGGEDIDRGTLRLAWNQQISEDWGISAGIEHRYRREEYESGAANSNAVFLTIARVMEFAR